METRKTASKSLATVGLSSMLGFLAARIAGYTAGNIDFYVFIFLFGLFFANVIYLYLFTLLRIYSGHLSRKEASGCVASSAVVTMFPQSLHL